MCALLIAPLSRDATCIVRGDLSMASKWPIKGKRPVDHSDREFVTVTNGYVRSRLRRAKGVSFITVDRMRVEHRPELLTPFLIQGL